MICSAWQISLTDQTVLNIPSPVNSLVLPLRDDTNGSMVLVWLEINKHITSYKGFNFTDGHKYSGAFSYLTAE